MRRPLLVLLLVAGCGDVDGLVVVTIDAVPPLSNLATLHLSATAGGRTVSFDDHPPAAFSLPPARTLGIEFPPSVAGTMSLHVEAGDGAGKLMASGDATIVARAGQRSDLTITLGAGGSPDLSTGGALDLGSDGAPELGPVDLSGDLSQAARDGGPDLAPPATIVFSPTTLSFPDTPRGTQQAVTKTIQVTNHTALTLSAMMGAGLMLTGDDNAFHFEPSTTCNVTNNGFSFTAGATCNLVLSFQPDATGALSQGITATFNDGEVVALTFQGNGLAAFSAEGNSVTTNFRAAWASGPTDWWAVGLDTSCPIWRSAGDGNWHTDCGGVKVTSRNFYSINGSAANNVWLGADNGNTWHYDGSNYTLVNVNDASVTIPGIIAFSTSEAVAIDNNSAVYCLPSSPSAECNFIAANQNVDGFTATCLSGVNLWVEAGGLGRSLYQHQTGITGWIGYTYNGTGFTNTFDINGVWMAPNANQDIFAVGAVGTMGAIYHVPDSEMPGMSQGALLAVAGRVPPGGGLDVYIVGDVGQQVLHSNGNGTWTGLPSGGVANVANHGVWVASDGTVVAVGDGGQILHYH